MAHDPKYNDVVMRFSYYYKFTFYFKGTADDGSEVYASIGGSTEDIYRFEVSSDAAYRLGGRVDGFEFENVSVTERKESNPQVDLAGASPAQVQRVVGRQSEDA